MAIVIDATDMIVGRLASYAAKQALLGETVDVVNCENAIISGDKYIIFEKHKHLDDMGGPHWGPFRPKMADRFLRRAIRNMLPQKRTRGKEAYKRIMCWLGVPDQFKNAKLETIKGANVSKLPNTKYIKVSELMDFLKHRR